MTGRLLRALLVIAAGFSTVAATANEQSNAIRDRLGNRRSEVAAVSRFERADGEGGFVLDRAGSGILFRWNDSSEVMVLSARRAAGGETSLVTDWGHELLRVNTYGGATLYPPDVPSGVIADAWEPAGPLRMGNRTVEEVTDRIRWAASALREELGHGVQVDYGAAPRDGLAVMFEAIDLTVTGIRKARLRDERAANGLVLVRFVVGDAADVRYSGTELIVEIDPDGGFAGRPSSERIAHIVAGETQSS